MIRLVITQRAPRHSTQSIIGTTGCIPWRALEGADESTGSVRAGDAPTCWPRGQERHGGPCRWPSAPAEALTTFRGLWGESEPRNTGRPWSSWPPVGGGHAQFTEASGSRVPHSRFADLPSKARCATRSQTGLPTTCSEWPCGTLTTRRGLAGAGASRPRAAPGHSRRPRGLREARLRGPGKRDCPLRYRGSSARPHAESQVKTHCLQVVANKRLQRYLFTSILFTRSFRGWSFQGP